MTERVELPLFESWLRVPGESARNFAAFCEFRDLPPGERTAEKAALAYNQKNKPRRNASQKPGTIPNLTTFREWSARFRWIERASAYDEFLDKQKQAERVASLTDEATIASRVRAKLLRKLEEKLDSTDISASALPEFVRALNGLLEAGPKVEAELRAKKLLPEVVLDTETGNEVEAEEEDERLLLIAAEERVQAAGGRVSY